MEDVNLVKKTTKALLKQAKLKARALALRKNLMKRKHQVRSREDSASDVLLEKAPVIPEKDEK